MITKKAGRLTISAARITSARGSEGGGVAVELSLTSSGRHMGEKLWGRDQLHRSKH